LFNLFFSIKKFIFIF